MKRVFIFILFVSCSLFEVCASAQHSYPDPNISVDNLKAAVTYLTKIEPACNYRNLRSLNKAGDYISAKFAEYGFKPQRQEFVANKRKYSNIIASAGTGKDPLQVVVVGAHYDVCGDQPGADDNASAVAGLLEIARFAKKHEKELPCRIEFVAYSLEEPPFFDTEKMGSYVHAKSLFDKKMKVKGMICLEMIGFFTDAKDSQRFPLGIMKLLYPNEGNFIAVVSNHKNDALIKHTAKHMKKASINVETLKAPSFVQGMDFSDHRNYWKFGYDAVMVTDTAFYRNPNYHKKTDTIETLSFDKMKEVVKGVCWTILNF
jgi:Zn-dependent M28 family amino/carboxypeptidase